MFVLFMRQKASCLRAATAETCKVHSCLVQRGTSTTTSTSSSAPFRQPTKNLAGKCTPTSLTVCAMLKLGRVVQTTTTLANLFSFQIETMTWSTVPVPVEFVISSHLLGEGGFRKAYKASTKTKDFAKTTWVVKKYKPEALQVIKDNGQSVEEHTKKVVQMHHLARNFAAQLHKKVMEDDVSDDDVYPLQTLTNMLLQLLKGKIIGTSVISNSLGGLLNTATKTCKACWSVLHLGSLLVYGSSGPRKFFSFIFVLFLFFISFHFTLFSLNFCFVFVVFVFSLIFIFFSLWQSWATILVYFFLNVWENFVL